MPFRSAIRDAVAIEFNCFSNGVDHIAIACVGRDDDLGATYSLFTAFSPTAGGIIEHVFCIYQVIDRSTTELWDGGQTKALIPLAEDRLRIKEAVLAGVDVLLETSQPDFIVHATHSANLPRKALTKHRDIMSVFEARGYDIKSPDPYHGRRLWHATKRVGKS